MKKPVIAALAAVALSALAVVAAPTFAQGGPGQAHRGEAMKKMADALGLTDDQKAQIKTIMQGARQQAQAIKADTTLTADIKKAKLQALGESARQQALAVLTPEQREKLKAMRQQHGKAGNG